ncbi:LPO_1073/Vpar_1526 family protein [Acinetobacter baumannii]|uniref:LPO_1073/Vpar_1526 family protein n=1 Tax=Acinetobacter baumannii TaxID=470 RepID=UPI003AF522ED
MGDRINQAAEAIDGSTINQAGNDIHINYGPKMNEILQAIDYQVSRQFEGLLHKHAPVLIRNEFIKIENSINEFKEKISSKLLEKFEKLKITLDEESAGEKLTQDIVDSNFQYLFQDSLEQIIRKKDQAPQDVLVELLINKIASPEDSNYLIEEAIEVLKFLNKNHVNFILLIDMFLFHTGNKFNGVIDDDNKFFIQKNILFEIKWTLNYFLALNPSAIDFEYLTYKGLILERKKYTNFNNIPESINRFCYSEKFKLEGSVEKEELIDIFLPELKVVLNMYGLKYPYDFVVLSRISKVIADKSKFSLLMSIQRFKEANENLKEDWNKAILLELKKRGKV